MEEYISPELRSIRIDVSMVKGGASDREENSVIAMMNISKYH